MLRDIILPLIFLTTQLYCRVNSFSVEDIRVWGPGLEAHKIVMPARYFFIEIVDKSGVNVSSGSIFDVKILGEQNGKPCRIRINQLDRKDGIYIVRYKLFETCNKLQISVKYKNQHVAQSPYNINDNIYFDECDCPLIDINSMLKVWQCGEVTEQIQKDFSHFKDINWDTERQKVIERFDSPGAVSLCHYIIKSNKLYRKCYGKYVGFKMFMDSMLLSLLRKALLPDLEFFVNLGDWPLTSDDAKYPIFSWCGSDDSFDIVMPTYAISESTLENLGRVMLDMLSVQGNVNDVWENRIPKAFWRGRDSSRERLKLVNISREHPDLFNVSLTNFFFFREEQAQYGPKSEHVSFFNFFDFKYQVSTDGTVAAYRFPYLLGGGSLIFKQDSKYYEHFYKNLLPYVHYVPIKRDLSDLVDKLNWAIENDDEAKRIAKNGQKFAVDHLLPKDIFCYYSHLLNELSKNLKSPVDVLYGLEKVEQSHVSENCQCELYLKDEL